MEKDQNVHVKVQKCTWVWHAANKHVTGRLLHWQQLFMLTFKQIDGQKRPRSADALQTQLVCFWGCRGAPCWVSGCLVERFSYFGPKMFPVGATAPLCVQGEELIYTHTHTHTCFTIFVRTFSGINAFLSLLCSRLITTCTHKGCFFSYY